MSMTETLVENTKPITLDAIAADLNGGEWDALYYATEEQIVALIDAGRICEDFFSRHKDYQEEMRVMMNQVMAEYEPSVSPHDCAIGGEEDSNWT